MKESDKKVIKKYFDVLIKNELKFATLFTWKWIVKSSYLVVLNHGQIFARLKKL